METVFERVAALDVHKAQVTACVRVPALGGRREQHLAEFATTVRGLARHVTSGDRPGAAELVRSLDSDLFR